MFIYFVNLHFMYVQLLFYIVLFVFPCSMCLFVMLFILIGVIVAFIMIVVYSSGGTSPVTSGVFTALNVALGIGVLVFVATQISEAKDDSLLALVFNTPFGWDRVS